MGIYEKNNCRILGKGQWISNDDIKSGLNNNDLIIGGTGSGKTGGYVIPNIRQANGNMVITDTKSILYKKLGKELEKQGYDVSILDFVNPERSDTYNPLEYIRTVNHFGLADYNHKDIISLSRVLVPTRIKHDPFWEESARTVMAFLIAFTLEALREEDHCMSSIVELYRQLGMENGKKRFEVWCMEHPNSFAAKKYAMFCGVMNVDRTWGCISQFLAEALEPFDFREMEYIFGRTGAGKKINLSDLWEKKKVIFLNISDTDRYADRVANLFWCHHRLDMHSNIIWQFLDVQKLFLLNLQKSNESLPDQSFFHEVIFSSLRIPHHLLRLVYQFSNGETYIPNAEHGPNMPIASSRWPVLGSTYF